MNESMDVSIANFNFDNNDLTKKCKYCSNHCHIENPEEIENCENFNFHRFYENENSIDPLEELPLRMYPQKLNLKTLVRRDKEWQSVDGAEMI